MNQRKSPSHQETPTNPFHHLENHKASDSLRAAAYVEAPPGRMKVGVNDVDIYFQRRAGKEKGKTCEDNRIVMASGSFLFHNRAISCNVSRVGDVAPSPTRARGHVAERRAAAPRSPRRLPRRRCAYALLCAVAPMVLCQPFRGLSKASDDRKLGLRAGTAASQLTPAI